MEDQAPPLIEPKDPPRSRIPFLLMVFFYLLFLGAVGAKLAVKLLPSDQEAGSPAPEVVHAKFQLTGVSGEEYSATIGPVFSNETHGSKLTGMWLSELGVDAKSHSLFTFRLVNNTEQELQVPKLDQIQLVRDAGATLKPKELPLAEPESDLQLRLAQRRLAGSIPPKSYREFWLLFDAPLTMEAVKEAKVGIGESTELNLVRTAYQ